jgi:kynurenine formamidase
MGVDVGTHVDSPAHWQQDARSIEFLTADELICPLVVLDVRENVLSFGSDDYGVSVEDIIKWEKVYGPVPSGAVVVAHTGWCSKYTEGDGSSYVNNLHFPGFTEEAAAFLLAKGIHGLGIDTLSTDIGNGGKFFPVHDLILPSGKYQIENLNLPSSGLPPFGALIIVAPLRIVGASEMAARVFALIPSKDE